MSPINTPILPSRYQTEELCLNTSALRRMENPIIPPTRELKPRRGEKIKDEGQELMERKMVLHSNLSKTLLEFLSHSIYLFTCLALLLRAGDIAEDIQDNPSHIFHLCFSYTTAASYLLFTILMNTLLDSFFFNPLSFSPRLPFRILTELSEKLMLFFI